MIRVGVVGCGYWGPKLVRNFHEHPDACVSAVCDLSADRLAPIVTRYPSVRATRDPFELVRMPEVDAVVIATPVATHFALAMAALRAGRHVLVEKPLADSAESCERLIDEAQARDLVLMVDHTFVYTGAVQRMRPLMDEGAIGEVLYYDSVRINLGLFQHDVNVLWDLAVHDLAIMDHLLRRRPVAVSATGAGHLPGGVEDVAYMTLFFDGDLIAHVHVNWLAPVKIRHTLIGGDRKMIVYNDLEPAEKVRVYDRGVTRDDDGHDVSRIRFGYRTGDMWAPRVDTTEALWTEAGHFVRCVAASERPLTDGEAGLRVVRVLEAAARSVAERGRPVELIGATA